jgi:hypothetical protein
MKTILIGVAFAAAFTAGTAQAHQWYVLDAGAARCLDARAFARVAHVPDFASPYRLEMFALAAGIFQNIDVERDEAGQPYAVMITAQIGAETTTMAYFSKLDMCQVMAATLPSPNELN